MCDRMVSTFVGHPQATRTRTDHACTRKPEEVYTDEIKDLWSANDQMVKALTTLTEGVHDKKLKQHFTVSLFGIGTPAQGRRRRSREGALQVDGRLVQGSA